MGLSKPIKDINKKEFKNVQLVLNALSILGITEEMLEDIKNIYTLKEEIRELQEFKMELTKTVVEKSKQENNEVATPQDIIRAMNEPIEEFKPYGK